MTTKSITRTFIVTSIICVTIIGLKFVGFYNKEDKGVIGFFGRLLNPTNSFNVTYNNVDKKDVDVIWRSEFGDADTLVRDGTMKTNDNYDYGKEAFIVFYRDTFLSSGGFFSTNNNDVHAVNINISKTSTGFDVTFTIDNEKFVHRLDEKRNSFNN